MICVSLVEESLSACLEAVGIVEFAEIRMDAMPFLTLDDVRAIFSHPARLIATFRPVGSATDEMRKAMLITAIESGAAYVDVEIESEPDYRNEIIERACSCGCKIIVSFHDFEKTPERPDLETIVSSCFEAGADIAKIACMVHADRDNARLLGLLETPGRQVVVVGMGKKGSITRVAAPLSGSPFTFASLSMGKETASGQIDRETLKTILEVFAHK